MYGKNLKASLVLIGAGLFLLIPPLQAQQQPGSVLSRVQTVEDPELGDLIRVAIENCDRTSPSPTPDTSPNKLKPVQEVTESYARIKLLDDQIEQTARKIKGDGSGGVLQEMALAKAELESKRTIELAKLRQIMQVIPAHAFARRPVSELKTWLHLDALGERVIVYTSRRPFDQRPQYSLVGMMSRNAALEYVAGQMKREDRLPIRIDIYRTVEGLPLSEQLNSESVQLVKKTNIQMQAEVHLEEVGQRVSRPTFVVEKGKVGTGHEQTNGGVRVLAGIVEPNDLDG